MEPKDILKDILKKASKSLSEIITQYSSDFTKKILKEILIISPIFSSQSSLVTSQYKVFSEPRKLSEKLEIEAQESLRELDNINDPKIKECVLELIMLRLHYTATSDGIRETCEAFDEYCRVR